MFTLLACVWWVVAHVALGVSGAPSSQGQPARRLASVSGAPRSPGVGTPARGQSAAAEMPSFVFDVASPPASRASSLLLESSRRGGGGASVAAQSGRSTRQRRKAIREDIFYWPEAKIPYQIDKSIDDISTMARSKIEKAIGHWEQTTCIRFVPYNATAHSSYLIFMKGFWCASKLGMTGGPQPLYLAAGCLTTGTIVHELGHSVGWVHEQTRPDRDEHVDINWNVISPLYRPQYDKYSSAYVNTFGIPYDHSSIMHYPSYGELSARDVTKQAVMGQRERLSFYDAKLANVMYKCADRRGCDTSNIECTSGGYVGPDCKCVCPDGSSRCTTSNDISQPVMDAPAELPPADVDPLAASAERTRDSCEEWNRVENTFIVGHNDDVVFGVGVEECKARCESERAFLCRSVNYWRERRHCFLSSASKRTHGKVALAHDERILHFERNVCGGGGGGGSAVVSNRPPPVDAVGRRRLPVATVDGTKQQRPLPPQVVDAVKQRPTQVIVGGVSPRPLPVTDDAKRQAPVKAIVGGGPAPTRKQPPQQQQPQQQQPQQRQPDVEGVSAAITAGHTAATPATVVAPVGRRYSVRCSPEYVNVRDVCLRIVASTQRPAHLAGHECKNRLQASLWNYADALKEPLGSLLPDGEYWVNVVDYKSDNSLAGFFRFCPYVRKANGVAVLGDSFCYQKKGFICVGEQAPSSLKETRQPKKSGSPASLPH